PSATAKPAPTNEATGKISVAKPDAAPAPAGKDSLKIAQTDAANAKTGAAGDAGVAKLQTEISALKEEKIARENALKEANSRVADLEKQISDMRKLMELKGLGKDGKADPKADPKAAVKPDVKAPEPPKPADTKVAQVTTPAKPGEAPKVDAKPSDAKPADTKPADAKPADAKPAEAPKVADAKPADAKPAPPKAPPKTPPKAPPPPPEPSFLEEWGLALGGGTAALLAGGGIFAFMRSRKKKAEKGPSSTSLGKPSSIMPSDLKPNTSTGGKSGGGLVDTGNSSFLTDFDKTGPGSIDTDEVDPVAEAEVYIAYGRDAQAEEILKEAMVKDKSRHEVTVKLLEIYHARKSIQAFDTVARELKDAIGTDNPMWAKVAAMGASIDPQNGLYAGSGQAYATTGAFAAAGEGIQAEKPDVDFDLGFNSNATTSQSATFDVTAATTDQPAAPSADFDLDLGGATAAPEPAAPADSGGLDFDLALGGDSTPAPAPPAAPAASAADSGFDFDLSGLSMDTPASAAAEDFSKTLAMTATPAHEKTASLNLSDLSLDLGDSKPAAAASGGASDSAVSTKLELAKAYVEIGDTDGAKEILNEVAREGSPSQQDEAKKILAGL
ncbi:MAG: hypothetical protein JNJ55_11770, partial [Betaproteobacteria bacterium]|nr:hypothetical protein [Betaproteobacteria bacterium]